MGVKGLRNFSLRVPLSTKEYLFKKIQINLKPLFFVFLEEGGEGCSPVVEEQLTDSLIHAQLLGLVLAVAKEISKGAIPSWQFPTEEFSDLEWVLLKQLILMFTLCWQVSI